VAWLPLSELPEVTREDDDEESLLDDVDVVEDVLPLVVPEVVLVPDELSVAVAVVACAAAMAPVAASEVARAPPTMTARVRPARRVARKRARTSGSCSSMVEVLSWGVMSSG
jgi:hypothetical protein